MSTADPKMGKPGNRPEWQSSCQGPGLTVGPVSSWPGPRNGDESRTRDECAVAVALPSPLRGSRRRAPGAVQRAIRRVWAGDAHRSVQREAISRLGSARPGESITAEGARVLQALACSAGLGGWQARLAHGIGRSGARNRLGTLAYGCPRPTMRAIIATAADENSLTDNLAKAPTDARRKRVNKRCLHRRV